MFFQLCTAQEARRVAQSATQGQGFVQRWFPGWWSGYSESPVSKEQQPQDDPGQGMAPPTVVDEEELLDELGLDEDAGDQLMRDRMFATVSFHLDTGMLQLVTHQQDRNSFGPEPIVELEVWIESQIVLHLMTLLWVCGCVFCFVCCSFQVNGLECNVDYRPRLRYSSYQLSLNGVTLTDHYQQDSRYPILAQPRNIMVGEHKVSIHCTPCSSYFPLYVSVTLCLSPSLSFSISLSLSLSLSLTHTHTHTPTHTHTHTN